MALRKQELHDDDQQSTKRTRITFDASPQLRRRIKMAAHQRDVSIGEYLGNILEEAVPQESKLIQERHPATSRMSERLRRVREEILQDREGKPFEDSVETLHELRKERSKELDQL